MNIYFFRILDNRYFNDNFIMLANNRYFNDNFVAAN